jgi:hypothetical protein
VPKWIRGLAVAALLVAVVVTLSRWPRPHQRPPTPAPPRDLARVEIRRPEGAVRLEKTGETWFVASPVRAPAGEGLVTAVASALNELTLEAVLSERPESHALFEVNEASGTLLRVWDVGAGVPTEWWVGRTAPDTTRAYLRKPGDNRVYLARGLRRRFSLTGKPNRWREGRLLPLPAPARARVDSGGAGGDAVCPGAVLRGLDGERETPRTRSRRRGSRTGCATSRPRISSTTRTRPSRAGWAWTVPRRF